MSTAARWDVFVYVAGPYTARKRQGWRRLLYLLIAWLFPWRSDEERNTNAAIAVAADLLALGICPYVPHLSHYIHLRHPFHYETWMGLDFAWISRCDALLRLLGPSSGADREVALATKLGIPVFYSEAALLAWVERRRRACAR